MTHEHHGCEFRGGMADGKILPIHDTAKFYSFPLREPGKPGFAEIVYERSETEPHVFHFKEKRVY